MWIGRFPENGWRDWLCPAVHFLGWVLSGQNPLALTAYTLAVRGSSIRLRYCIHRWHSRVDLEVEEMAVVVLSLHCSIYEFRLHRAHHQRHLAL